MTRATTVSPEYRSYWDHARSIHRSRSSLRGSSPRGLARRLYAHDDADVYGFPADLLNYLLEHYGRAVVHAPPVRPTRPITARMAALGAGKNPGPIPRDQLCGLTPLEKIEYALEQIGIGTRETETGQIVSRCPLHQGDRDNFSVRELADDGRVLLYCHRCSCEVDELVGALGLRVSDLFPARDFRPKPGGGRRRSHVQDVLKDGMARVTDEMAEAWQEEADRYSMALRSQREGPDHALLQAKRLGLPINYSCDSRLSSPDRPDYGLLLAERLGLPLDAIARSLELGLRLENRRKPSTGPGSIWRGLDLARVRRQGSGRRDHAPFR